MTQETESVVPRSAWRSKFVNLLSRYVVLNPAQAGMTETAGDWPWSSYRAGMGKAPAPDITRTPIK